MKTQAAVLTDRNVPWEIMELDVRDPKENEVLIRYTAAGLCHSDMRLVTCDLPMGRKNSLVSGPGPGPGRAGPRRLGEKRACPLLLRLASVPATSLRRTCETS